MPPARVYASVRVYEKRIQAHTYTYMENARKTRYIYICLRKRENSVGLTRNDRGGEKAGVQGIGWIRFAQNV